jgi:ATPase
VSMKSDKRATVRINEDNIPKLIGKKGKTIDEVEKKIGISIGVEALEVKEIKKMENSFKVDTEISGNYVVLNFKKNVVGTPFDILVDEDYLFTATVGKKGNIKIKQDIELATIIVNAMKKNIPIYARIRQE